MIAMTELQKQVRQLKAKVNELETDIHNRVRAVEKLVDELDDRIEIVELECIRKEKSQ